MKTINIEYRDYNVSDETYDKVLQLVEGEKVCQDCGNTYSDSNPMVSLNMCLNCVLSHENFKHETLEYLEKKEERYYFINKNPESRHHNYIYTSFATNNQLPILDEIDTINYYGFITPTTADIAGLGDNNYLNIRLWAGNPTTDNIIIIKTNYNKFVNSKYVEISNTFISIKNEGVIKLNKRKKYVRELLKEGREKEIENGGTEWQAEYKSYDYLCKNGRPELDLY